MKIKINHIPLIYLTMIAILLNILFFQKGFLDFESLHQGGVHQDGYLSQVYYIYQWFESGASFYGESPTIFIHISRALIAFTFDVFNQIGGIPLQTLLLYSMIAFTLHQFIFLNRFIYLCILLFPPLFISWRAVLVMISILNLVAFFNNKKGGAKNLLLSFLFSSLSSATLVLSSTAILYLAKLKLRKLNFFFWSYFYLILLSFFIMLVVKYIGYSTSAPGYNVEGSDNIIYNLVAGSSVYFKISQGGFYQKIFYGLMPIISGIFLVKALLIKRKDPIIYIFLLSLSGLFVTGLGVLPIFPLILLIFTKFRFYPSHTSQRTYFLIKQNAQS